MPNKAATMFSLLALGAAGSIAAAELGDFYYDATDASHLSFNGSLEAGSLALDSIPGRSYRVQRAGWADQTHMGVYIDDAVSLELSVELSSYHSAGQGGPNDQALFGGVGALRGHDLIITDSAGNEMSARISLLELIDDTDSWVQPALLGAALLEDITFSRRMFEGVGVFELADSGFLSFTALTNGNLPMHAYFNGEEGQYAPLLLGTLEITIGQAVPAPGGAAVLGLGAAGFARRRRRPLHS